MATSCTGIPWRGGERVEKKTDTDKVETAGATLKRSAFEHTMVYTQHEPEAKAVLPADFQREPDYGLALFRFTEFRPKVVSFYSGETGSESIALTILQAADTHNIPLSLAFSLAWVESRYDSRAVNYNSSSVDRGLFQLNNRSFPGLTEMEFFNPEINSRLGMDYLRQCLNAGDTEIVALAMYNAGRARVSGRGTPIMTLEYISRILEHRDDLDNRFSEYFLLAKGRKDAFKSSLSFVPVDRNKVIK